MNTASWDLLLTGATLATFDGGQPYGLIEDGALAMAGGRIAWIGPRAQLPADAQARAASVEHLEIGRAHV